jgi:excinuclease ABC subunit C
LAQTIPFAADAPGDVLGRVPPGAAVFALRFGAGREPYIAQTTDLQRRLRRMLSPDAALSRRLQLLPLLKEVSWTTTGSAFETALLLYRACVEGYGPEAARKRLRLRPPAFLRFAGGNAFPRLYVTHRLGVRALHESFGPVASRAAAERALESVLDLFQLRRCIENLEPHPDHPGCLYGEMRRCLAPCKQSCTEARYAEEAAEVFQFLRTRGESLLQRLGAERTAASDALEFELAAQAHARYERVAAAARELPECMWQLSTYRAVVVQPSAEEDAVALFGVKSGSGSAPRITGPVRLCIAGIRLPNERSGSSSLFAHPVALTPVPLEDGATLAPPETLQDRLAAALRRLEGDTEAISPGEEIDHLALFARWCARPQTQREGEVLFSDPQTGDLPQKEMLRAIARTAAARIRQRAERPA